MEITEYPKTVEELKDYKFFILDIKEKKSIAVHIETEYGYDGVSFVKEADGYNLSPFFIARSFIEIESNRYDFTKNYHDALKHCS